MSSLEYVQRIGAAAKEPANWAQLLRFSLVGGTGYFVNLAVFAALVDLADVHHILAAVIAFCFAVTNNFILNRHWTFDARDGAAGFQAVRFFAVSVASLMLNLGALALLVGQVHMADVPAQAISVAIATPFNFIGNRLWTFA
ncbi:MAG TPA: GtrA family protein [Myxococcaceae bacterium]|nr:GtrA family protein [Myxococcaceae bacterium]